MQFMVSHARREEKGSDINAALHLLVYVLDARVRAAIVISNDSDLCRRSGPRRWASASG